jgi:sugar lactone lactonase YvrE
MDLTSPNLSTTPLSANRGTTISYRKPWQTAPPEKSGLLLAWSGLFLLSCLAIFSAPAASAQTNIIHTVAGGALPNAVATSADIAGPTSAVADAAGNIYITAPYSYYVFKVSGTQLGIVAGRGFHGFSGEGGPANKALLGAANGVALDAQGNLYIADFGANRIRKIDAAGNIKTIAGDGNSCHRSTSCGDGPDATKAQLGFPRGLAVDSAGNIFIADTSNEKIREVKTDGSITTIAGTGLICDGPNFRCGDGGPGTQVGAKLNLPTGVAVDNAGHVYVGDTKDQRIRVIDLNTGIINTAVGRGRICNGSTRKCGDGGPLNEAEFTNTRGVALDRAGNIYIADSYDNRIRKADFVNNLVTTVAGSGVPGFSGDGGGARKAYLSGPNGIFVDAAGNLVIPDTGNQRIRVVSHSIINTVAGGGLGNDGNPAKTANLANPNAVVWGSAQSYYIADAANNRIREVSSGTISTVVGTGSAGWSGDGGPAASATLNNPLGVTLDSSNNIFIADSGNVIVRKVVNGTISTIAGNGDTCFPTNNPCGDGGPATAALLSSPTTVAVDGAGNVFIADVVGNRIRKVDTNGMISTFAGTGVAGYSGDNGPATKAKLSRPDVIPVDVGESVDIADSNNSRIRRVNNTGTITTFALNGKGGYSGDGGLATAASMLHPFQVAFDPAGNLYIGGGVYQVVRKVDAGTGIITTVAGNVQNPGKQGFAGDGGPATQATLDNSGLAIDGSGNLLIADQGNNRIREVPIGTASQR